MSQSSPKSHRQQRIYLLLVLLISVILFGFGTTPVARVAAQEATPTPSLSTEQKINQILEKIRAVQATQDALVTTVSTQIPTSTATPTISPTLPASATVRSGPTATLASPVTSAQNVTDGTRLPPSLTIARPLVNLRSGPGTNYTILGSATSGESFTISGRNLESSWYEIELANGTLAWVWSGIVTLRGSVDMIAEATPTTEPATTESPADATTSTTSASKSAGGGAAAGRLLYSVANLEAERWELWEYSFATESTRKTADWRTELDVSRDGTQIAYFAWPEDAGDKAGIWIMDGDYANNRLLVEGGAYPSFNPGGDRLVLNSGEDIYIINSDGGGLRWLTAGEYPAWSPVDNRIVYRTCVGGSCGLWVIDANSQDPNARRRITTGGSDGQPAWSPNGERVAYISQEDGNFEIYVINADGSGKQRLTTEPASDGLPVWSPDGDWVAFRSDRSGSWAIHIMRPDGSDLRKVVDADVLPLWFFEKMIWQY